MGHYFFYFIKLLFIFNKNLLIEEFTFHFNFYIQNFVFNSTDHFYVHQFTFKFSDWCFSLAPWKKMKNAIKKQGNMLYQYIGVWPFFGNTPCWAVRVMDLLCQEVRYYSNLALWQPAVLNKLLIPVRYPSITTTSG